MNETRHSGLRLLAEPDAITSGGSLGKRSLLGLESPGKPRHQSLHVRGLDRGTGPDAKTGRDLWHFYTGHTIFASPVTYSVDGKQYVSIATESDIVNCPLFDRSRTHQKQITTL